MCNIYLYGHSHYEVEGIRYFLQDENIIVLRELELGHRQIDVNDIIILCFSSYSLLGWGMNLATLSMVRGHSAAPIIVLLPNGISSRVLMMKNIFVLYGQESGIFEKILSVINSIKERNYNKLFLPSDERTFALTTSEYNAIVGLMEKWSAYFVINKGKVVVRLSMKAVYNHRALAFKKMGFMNQHHFLLFIMGCNYHYFLLALI
ncbi:hypothetical protein ACVQ8M_04020 [Edwardsiella tarda]